MEFILKQDDRVADFYYEAEAFTGVCRIADKVREDVKRVTGARPENVSSVSGLGKYCVYFATIGRSPLLDRLAAEGRIDLGGIRGKREVYGWFLLEEALEGVDKLLVIAGSDKRGTIYGLFHMSDRMGVSPFVDWSDVKPLKKENIIFDETCFGISKEPAVCYRGFFINDEWPAFGNWCTKHFGGVNVDMYEHVFELLLRLKGNYLWPAMWASCFALDGPGLKNAELADEYGVIIGLSHHEPCLRHGDEYRRLRGRDSVYGDAWNFRTNEEGITRFWEDGLKRNGHLENIITIGMRGERDSAIMDGHATLKDNIDLLKNVITTQHRLIRECVNENLQEVPRMLALYKEVEPFFYGDQATEGLKEWEELEDVILLLCDDNHGYLRTLPDEKMREHRGGYGMYYHFDYHGEPVSFEWTNSSYLPQVWEQMTTAYEYGIRKLWIVNVGDLGLQEFPLSYFMELAYDYEKWGISAIGSAREYTLQWVENQFKGAFDNEDIQRIADLIEEYTHISHNRRPEHMGDGVYHPVHNYEAWNMLQRAEEVIRSCNRLLKRCPEENRPAFYELVYYNAVATMNIHKMWIYSSWNHYLAERGAIVANICAEKVRECMAEDLRLQKEFDQMADGKWEGFALAKHIGFRKWNAEERRNPVLHTVLPLEEPCLFAGLCDNEIYTYGGEWNGKKLQMDAFCNPFVDSGCFYLASGSDLPVEYSISCDQDWLVIKERIVSFGEKDNALSGSRHAKSDELTERNCAKSVVPSEDRSGNSADCERDGLLNAEETGYLSGDIRKEKPLLVFEIICDRRKLKKFATQMIQEGSRQDDSSQDGIWRADISIRSGECCITIEVLARVQMECREKVFPIIHGYAAIDAKHFAEKKDSEEGRFTVLEKLGRDSDGVKAFPVTKDFRQMPMASLPYVEYRFDAAMDGAYRLLFYLEPTNPVFPGLEITLRYSVNEEEMREESILSKDYQAGVSREWEQGVLNHVRLHESQISVRKGENRIRFFAGTPGIVLDKIVIAEKDAIKPSYFGPAEHKGITKLLFRSGVME